VRVRDGEPAVRLLSVDPLPLDAGETGESLRS
jgi:hypothetical protein